MKAKATQDALGMVFEPDESDFGSVREGGYEKEEDADVIRETQAVYQAEKRQGEYTIEDYYAIRDECRVELIDGVLYDMAAPKILHQIVGFRIGTILDAFIGKKKGSCILSAGPVSTQLDCDDKTMLEPDLSIVCDRNKIRNGIIYGAPDLVIEILSRSTAKRDKTVKKAKYQKAGVREYWIVDPEKKKITVYCFEKEESSTLYSFEDKVPVGIFAGECEVDFSEIYEAVRFLYESSENNI